MHSQSARELVTDLFKRQATDKNVTRGEALRQAMGEVAGRGETAAPYYWAAFLLTGDPDNLRLRLSPRMVRVRE